MPKQITEGTARQLIVAFDDNGVLSSAQVTFTFSDEAENRGQDVCHLNKEKLEGAKAAFEALRAALEALAWAERGYTSKR